MSDPMKDWSMPGTPNEPIVIDHPLYRHAPAISLGIGVVAGIAIAVFSSAPWWMPIFAGFVVAAIVHRFLRPRVRSPSAEDEI